MTNYKASRIPLRRALEIGRSPYSRGQADASLHLPNFMVEQVSFRSVRIKWIRQLASVVSANQIYQPLGPFSHAIYTYVCQSCLYIQMKMHSFVSSLPTG